MKIKTINAPDMRLAMRAVRADLGPDAIILATERSGDGVMVTAAVDFETAARTLADKSDRSVAIDQARARVGRAARSETVPAADHAVSEELRVLRRLLETQMAQLAWNEYSRRSPLAAELQREFCAAGFDRDVMRSIVDQIGESQGYGAARRFCLRQLGEQLQMTGDRWLRFGGRIVLLGHSGAGKTTSALRLAAKWVERHGNRAIALVCAAPQGFRNVDNLASQARLLGIPSYAVGAPNELPELLASLSDKKLIITDTVGLAGGDAAALEAWASCCKVVKELECVAVCAASTRATLLEQLVTMSGAVPWAGALLTKLDDNTEIGGLLNCLLLHEIPLSFVTRGRRWLPDLHLARADELLAEAVREVPDADVLSLGRAEVA